MKKKLTPQPKAYQAKDKKRQNILYLILIGLIMAITGLVILDRLKIVDLYLDRILKEFFLIKL
jgi:hypothetical protein